MPGNVPRINNSQLKYKIYGDSAASFLVELKFENSYYDYSYTIDIDNETEGFLYLEPPPERDNVKIYVTAISKMGKKSEPFVFTNKEWWSTVSKSAGNYALDHTFTF